MQVNVKEKFKQTEIGQIPDDWEVLKVVDFAEVVGGSTPSTRLEDNFDGEIPWITPNDLSTFQERYINNGERNITEKGFINSGTKKLPKGTILLSSRAPVGYLAIANKEVTTNQGFKSLVPKENVDSLFVYYLLKNNISKLKDYATGSTFQELSGSALKGIEFILPPLDEQQKIAEVLGALDDKIELNRKMNKTLESLAQAIFNNLYIYNKEKTNWKEKPLEDFFDFLEGPGIRNWQYSDKGTHFINIRLINNGDIDIKSANFINQEDVDKKYQHFLLMDKDLVISTSGTLGRNAIVRQSHLPLLLNTSVIRFRPVDKVSYPFMYQYLNSELFLSEQSAMASGSAQVNFGPIHLKQMKLMIPDPTTLNRLNLVLGPIYNKIINNMDQIETLSQIRDSLLPRLISGKLRVR